MSGNVSFEYQQALQDHGHGEHSMSESCAYTVLSCKHWHVESRLIQVVMYFARVLVEVLHHKNRMAAGD